MLLIRHIAMPGNRIGAVVEELAERLIVGASMDKMNFRESVGSTAGGMDVQPAEIFDKFQSLINGKRSKVLKVVG